MASGVDANILAYRSTKKMMKKLLAVLLSVIISLAYMPAIAFAEDAGMAEEQEGTSVQGEQQITESNDSFAGEDDPVIDDETVSDAQEAEQNAQEVPSASDEDVSAENELQAMGEIEYPDVTLYALNSGYKDVISIPSGFAQTHQISVSGQTITSCQVTEGDSVTVTSSGLIKPRYVTWYNGGGYWTTFPIEGAETSVEVEFGESTINVQTNQGSFTVKVDVKNYAEVYADAVLDEFLENNITPDMTTKEKVTAITKYVAQEYDYDYNYQSYVSMVIYGGGDCWASTNTIVHMCKKIGLNAWGRNANKDGGAAGGHRNAIVEGDGVYYIAEAGFSGSKPRYYYVEERSTLYSIDEQEPAEEGVKLAQYDGVDENHTTLDIPESIDGKNVTEIGEDFGSRSTEGDKWVTVTVPHYVTKICKSAFNSCTSLISVSLPAAVQSIETFAFTNCLNLVNIVIDAGNTNYSAENGVIYNADKTKMICCPAAAEVIIPDSVTELDNYCLYYNTNVNKIRIPASVTKTGEGAFAHMGNAIFIFEGDMPDLGEHAFWQTNAVIYYPAGNSTWDTSNSYDADSISWHAYNNDAKDISECDVTVPVSKVSYAEGEAIEPDVQITDGDKVLQKGVDYTLIYSNNTEIGKADVLIYGEGSYYGSTSTEFQIIPRLMQSTKTRSIEVGDTGYIYFDSDQYMSDQTLTASVETPGIISIDEEELEYNELAIKGLKAGSTKVTVSDNYGQEITFEVTVYEEMIGLWDAYVMYSRVTYSGKAAAPRVVVYDDYWDELTKDKHYSITYYNNVNVGTATFKVIGLGNHYGTLIGSFQILPKGTTLTKLTPKKKSFKVTWKRQPVQTTGYEVQYSLKKSMKGAKILKVKKNAAYSATVKKLKKKKKYFVRIRTYKTVGGKNYYSSWSPVRSVKVK